ncbi:hypothetical protein ABZ756_01985 [Mammaliicoccus sciuri]
MTAEVGILNRMGVALAADSAVTIGSLFNQKVYNSASKLFSLSKHHPVGIMIYGSADFMGVPWEIIIKSFRKKIGITKFDTLKEYSITFFDYLQTDQNLLLQYAESQQVRRIFNSHLIDFLNSINQDLNNQSDDAPTEEMVKSAIEDKLEVILERLEGIEYVENLPSDFQEAFLKTHSETIKSVIENNIYIELDDLSINNFLQFAVQVFSRNIFSDVISGIVISGYGETEIFPSLYEYEVEGLFSNFLIKESKEVTKIGSESNEEFTTASVRAFAQKEMVQMFMHGMDPTLGNTLLEILDESLTNFYPEQLEKLLETEFTDEQKDKLQGLGNIFMEELFYKLEGLQYENFVYPIVDTVDLLPKEELAAMAEALVNLTSFKRKVTIDAETVGGPIDVAVISKGDGFIWIKRKHYFNPELNYHFFQKYLKGGVDDVSSNV